MRFLIHDYAGHPFQVQLSRFLSKCGYEVVHSYCASTHTPQGDLVKRESDGDNFDVRPIRLHKSIAKYNFVERYRLEQTYGRQLEQLCEEVRPDAVISGNTPTVAQYRLAKWGKHTGTRIVTWIQDMYGVAAYRLLSKRMPGLGHAVGKYFIHLDRKSYLMSDAIVSITEDFVPKLESWGIDKQRIHVIHNWATLDQLPEMPRDNEWARRKRLGDGLRFLYSGTLSIRHNPALLLELGRLIDERGLGQLIVVSEGNGVDWLKQQCHEAKLGAVRFFDFQPFDQMPGVLGSADVLLAILEPDAGVFCVPSKVLSYMCAGRPLLTAMPPENLAAKLVTGEQLGINVSPEDTEAFVRAARRLSDSVAERVQMGQAARQYAETNFDIEAIARRFLAVLAPGSTLKRQAVELTSST